MTTRTFMAGLLVLASAIAPAMAWPDAPKEGDTVIKTVDFPVVAASGKTYQCEKSEFGTHKKVGEQLVYALGVVDYSCEEVQHAFDLSCRVSWGPDESTPPDAIQSAQAVGEVRLMTIDTTKPDTIKMDPQTGELGSVAPNRIDDVATQFFREHCFPRIPQ